MYLSSRPVEIPLWSIFNFGFIIYSKLSHWRVETGIRVRMKTLHFHFKYFSLLTLQNLFLLIRHCNCNCNLTSVVCYVICVNKSILTIVLSINKLASFKDTCNIFINLTSNSCNHMVCGRNYKSGFRQSVLLIKI